MLSEEEKKAVEKFENLYIKEFNGEPITTDDRLSYIEGALITNLIEKLEQELNSLKEIEQLHQEENGKLRVELEQEKEKNKELEKQAEERFEVTMELIGANYIHKDKIKEKIEELEKECKQYEEMTPSAKRYDGIQKIDIQINILDDLLEV